MHDGGTCRRSRHLGYKRWGEMASGRFLVLVLSLQKRPVRHSNSQIYNTTSIPTAMQYTKSLLTMTLASAVLGSYLPSEPWATLTPNATYSGGVTDYASTFGIAVQPIATASSASAVAKRDAISQIGDGQIQATTTTQATAAPISQIGDGQIQATTATQAAAAPISQIGDGQIQATTATKATAAPVSQIGDGQIQATTTTLAPISQIGDGQIQATRNTTMAASQITDGQVQATTVSSAAASSTDPVKSDACKSDGTLQMNLKEGILTDGKGRIGSIVANRQFQFDGPPPQAGAIYAAGWSITPEGNLAIGTEDTFYQCLSGNFYNLYDRSLGEQCHAVHLEVIDLLDC